MEIRPLQGKALTAVRHSDAWINAYEGSVSSGKTIGSLIDWLGYCRRGPAGPLLMTGRTERTVINNLLLPLQDMLGPKRVKLNRGSGVVELLGRQVLLVGANNEAARTKIQGLSLAGAYADEASTLPESYFNMLTTRLRIHGARMWLTSNPEGPSHWLKTQWLDEAKLWIDRDGKHHVQPGGKDVFRATFMLEDNPNLDPEYVVRVKRSYTGLWYRRYVLAEWCVAEGAVFPMWDPDVHVVAELPKMKRVVAVGADHGMTNASAAVLVGWGFDDVLYAMAEWWDPRTDATVEQQSSAFRGWLAGQPTPEMVAVDPAAAGFRVQLTYDGLRVVNADNDVPYGLATLGSLFSTGRLKVHESCVNLLREIPGYAWDDKASAAGLDKPHKVNDHALDALRYGVVTTEALWRGQALDGTVFDVDVLDDELAEFSISPY